MEVHPIASELKLIAVAVENTPRLFDADSLHSPQDIVGDTWPSVRKPFAFPQMRHREDALFINKLHVKPLLRVPTVPRFPTLGQVIPL